MGYQLDLSKITIDEFKDILNNTEFIPSWKILEDNIDTNLDILKSNNINNLDELLIALKTKELIQDFSEQSGLPEKYLEVLNRMVKGFLAKPIRIKDFTCISEQTAEKLEGIGINNTLKLYPQIITSELRQELISKSCINKDELNLLTKLTDLTRIRWVNHTFAFVLHETGYDTTRKVAKANYNEMYIIIKELNKERELFKGQIGLKDMKMVVESARMLQSEIEY